MIQMKGNGAPIFGDNMVGDGHTIGNTMSHYLVVPHITLLSRGTREDHIELDIDL